MSGLGRSCQDLFGPIGALADGSVLCVGFQGAIRSRVGICLRAFSALDGEGLRRTGEARRDERPLDGQLLDVCPSVARSSIRPINPML